MHKMQSATARFWQETTCGADDLAPNDLVVYARNDVMFALCARRHTS